MVKQVPDRTGRFSLRPHYEPKELDRECEHIITRFLQERHGKIEFPVSTEDLTRLIERDCDDLDLYADLSHYGSDVEGVTEFTRGRKPRVRVSSHLAEDERRENRLRTTLSHEYGHVHFHTYLWEMEPARPELFAKGKNPNHHNCRGKDMLHAKQTDWMEWQAGYVCAALLAPASYVRKIVGAYQETNGLFGAVRHNGPHGISLTKQISAAFQISEEAALIRLRQLGFLADQDAGPGLF